MTDSFSWFDLIVGTLGGLAFFLFGMEIMTASMKKSLGPAMKNVLTGLSKNRISGALTGVLVTMITQSTGATTVMLLSFVESNLMKFAQTVPVILGANIGSTFMTQVIAFDISGFAIIPVFVGYFVKMIGKNDVVKDAGSAILGFGLVFYGMKILGVSLAPLKDLPEFVDLMTKTTNPIPGILAGTLATALIQSSSMFTGILMVFASQGLLSMDIAFALIIGSSIGTCMLIILASIGSKTASKRTMMAHVFSKVAGAFVFVWFITPLSNFLISMGNNYDISPERLVAHAHTVYNVGVTLVFLPFTNYIVKFIEWLIKGKPQSKDAVPHLRYIDNSVVSMPHAAQISAVSEIATLVKLTGRMFDRCIAIILDFTLNDPKMKKLNEEQIEKLDIKQNKINYLKKEIRQFILNVGKNTTDQNIHQNLFEILSALDAIERMGDMIHRSIRPLYKELEMIGRNFSNEGLVEIKSYSYKLSKEFKALQEAITLRDNQKLDEIKLSTSLMAEDVEKYKFKHISRLYSDHDDSLLTHEIHTQLIDDIADLGLMIKKISENFRAINLQ